MNYNDLLFKYKKIIKEEYKNYANMGSILLDADKMEKYKYSRIIFRFDSDIKRYQIKEMSDFEKIRTDIYKTLKDMNKPYFKMKPSVDYNSIKLSGYVLTWNIDKFLDKSSSYNFPKQFKEIIRLESGQQYMSDIDCSIIKLYRDGILSFDQLIESTKRC